MLMQDSPSVSVSVSVSSLSHNARNRKDGKHMPELSASSALSFRSWCEPCLAVSLRDTTPGLASELTGRGPSQMRNKSLTAAVLFPNDNSPRQLGRVASDDNNHPRQLASKSTFACDLLIRLAPRLAPSVPHLSHNPPCNPQPAMHCPSYTTRPLIGLTLRACTSSRHAKWVSHRQQMMQLTHLPARPTKAKTKKEER